MGTSLVLELARASASRGLRLLAQQMDREAIGILGRLAVVQPAGGKLPGLAIERRGHHDLVDRQKAARDAKEAARSRSNRDADTWKGDISKETSTLVTN